MTQHEGESQQNDQAPVDDPTTGNSKPSTVAGDWKAELRAMETLREVLEPLPPDAQLRCVQWLIETLNISISQSQSNGAARVAVDAAAPAAASTLPPKAFMSVKKPINAAERIACLAYYLTRHRGIERFKVGDLVGLNTDAAGAKFGNPSRDLSNAEFSSGYIVAGGGGGVKQITTRGEALVDALPDRDEVARALKDHPFRRRRPNGSKKSPAAVDES